MTNISIQAPDQSSHFVETAVGILTVAVALLAGFLSLAAYAI
jgi:hypothetical protein